MALTDRSGWLTAWLREVVTAGAARVAAALAWSAQGDPFPLAPPTPAGQQAAVTTQVATPAAWSGEEPAMEQRRAKAFWPSLRAVVRSVAKMAPCSAPPRAR